jgi:hypothetical protein
MSKHCPHAKNDRTPCVIRDGAVAYGFRSATDTKPRCVGCDWGPKSTSVARPADWDKIVATYLREHP